jgi:hypothetical protein
MEGTPMTASTKVKKLVTSALREESRRFGKTTIDSVITLVYRKIENKGGYRNFFGTAEIIVAVKNMIRSEAQLQLKSRMPENVYQIAMRNAPPDLVQIMDHLPAWIATGEGPGAIWVPSLKATVDEWKLNATLKYRKAAQTEKRAQLPADIALYLQRYGYMSLSEIITDVTS